MRSGEPFKQERKNIANFMIEFKALAMKADVMGH